MELHGTSSLFSSVSYRTAGVRGIELEEALSSTGDMNPTVIDRLTATKRESRATRLPNPSLK
jgi:hypothetical protein